MNRKSLGTLIAINLALVMGLLVVDGGQKEADAQLVKKREFMIVVGELQGRAEQIVYITDMSSSTTVATVYNSGANKFTPIGAWNIVEDVRRVAGGGNARP